MIVVRATKRLAQLLGIKLEAPTPTSSAVLGEWYANWLPTNAGPLVVVMNGPTRLAVLSRARTPDALVADVRQRLPRILDVLGVPDDVIARELKHFDAAVFTKTVERTLLGSLNEICGVINLQDDKEGASSPRHLDELEDLFANFIHMKMPEKHTADAVRARLGGADPRLH